MSAKFLRNYLIQNGNAFKNVGFDYIIRARIISYRQAVSLRTEQNKLRREKEKKNIDRIHTHMRNINAPKHRVYNVTFVATVSGCTFYTYIYMQNAHSMNMLSFFQVCRTAKPVLRFNRCACRTAFVLTGSIGRTHNTQTHHPMTSC